MDNSKIIAIVGIGGVFPGADSLDSFWDNISHAVDSARTPPEGRWSMALEDVYDPRPGADKVYSKRACFADEREIDLEGLDIDQSLLDELDPMFRLLISAGSQAWQDCKNHTIDRQRTGIIIGNIALPTDTASQLADEVIGKEIDLALGIRHEDRQTHRLNRYVAGLPAGLLARALGLGGTSFTLDAACASSLYALKYAVDELQAGRADAMLCGGLSRPDSLYTQMGFSTLGAVSASGRCAPFDKNADGLVVGEGAGILVLKRLQDAEQDGDQIYATIAGIGLSNDIEGNLMLPDSEGQLRAMQAAYRQADWSPHDVDLIECHGTGTPAGDRTEYNSMKSLWGNDVPPGRQCVIGSVKSNIGHLLTAAGSAGLIKVLLALRHRQLPPTANFHEPAGGIDLDDGPFEVLSSIRQWQPGAGQDTRRAAVSAFGFGGINAHVLLEEYAPHDHQPGVSEPAVSMATDSNPIAIVGMETHFGPWHNRTAFIQRTLTGSDIEKPATADNRWGIASLSAIRGYCIDRVEIPLGQFRIPPRELEDMLPQQLLMLKVAAAALNDAGLGDIRNDNRIDTGVFIGIGLDLNTTNFHLRWSMLDKARQWAREADQGLDDEQLQSWLADLRDSIGPPLSANRTMGALGGIVASRIARAFNIGGPGFTLSSEESSGMHALDVAIRTLQRGELDIAIAGAVDLGGDVRALEGQNHFKPYNESGSTIPFEHNSKGSTIGEGAVALVLKRLDDAVAAGDRIYATIGGLGSATGGDCNDVVASAGAYHNSVKRACMDARVDIASMGYIETHGSGDSAEDQLEATILRELFQNRSRSCAISSVKADIGHAGAAAGLASVARAALALHHEILPGLRNYRHDESLLGGNCGIDATATPRYWLHDRATGPRRALVASISSAGNCAHVILEQTAAMTGTEISTDIAMVAGDCDDALFCLNGSDRTDLQHQLLALENLVTTSASSDMQQLGYNWYSQQEAPAQPGLALSIVAGDPAELLQHVRRARQSLSSEKDINSDRLVFTDTPLAREGRLAFVFPGSGNHFHGMGQQAALRWPAILQRLQQENSHLASQFAGRRFWNTGDDAPLNHEEVIFGQVWLGTFMSDVIRHFGVEPESIIGYSLGETAGLFATRSWTDRDLMLERMQQSPLFKYQLAGDCEAARECWGLSNYVDVDWCVGVVNCPAGDLVNRIERLPWVYLLIINTPEECVIGGNRIAVELLVRELSCNFHPIDTITTVHCELARPVEQAYRDLHLFDTSAPEDVSFYSCIKGSAYEVTRESAADSIVGMAVEPFDFTRVINAAWEDGVRLFVETGPGASCSRMIRGILRDRPHITRAPCVRGKNDVTGVLQTLAMLHAHGVALDLSPLYPARPGQVADGQSPAGISVTCGHGPVSIKMPAIEEPMTGPSVEPARPPVSHAVVNVAAASAEIIPHPSVAMDSFTDADLIERMLTTESARAHAHETFLRVSNGLSQTLSQALSLQLSVLQDKPDNATGIPPATQIAAPVGLPPPFMDRGQCLEFATGSIETVLGAQFAGIDQYPTRVRLPDEPLMLVDRIIEVEGEPCSMGSGRVVTEHDIHPGAWYLDGGRIPTCIAVESGQADLFLSGYLGIDHITRGLAVYRLLDAEITFHGPLPEPGRTIRYDIRIDHFFRQGNTYLFRFSFDGSVDGEKLLTMRNGCAGFFSQAELDAGRGIVQTTLELREEAGILDKQWEEIIPMQISSYDDEQLTALRRGDLEACFGPLFAELPLQSPAGLPGGRMTLVHRILKLDPHGGRFGLGSIMGEADIHPDDWFLSCHFVDDQVMPGTLMYECCLHTLRIFLLRMGWVAELDEVIYEPVAEISSKLKCRGQVTADTDKVQYEIVIKELGYQANGTPYVIADALMYADNRPVVQMSNMSLQLSGLSRERIHTIWQSAGTRKLPRAGKQVLFDYDSILAFATGRPSEAFGERYRPFDNDRVIARLPGPPYQFLDRIVSIRDGEPWQLRPGAIIEAEYDVPADAWYFTEDRQDRMPFSVLLEVALQPCGWLAAYLGSALTSETDLSFRNLGGSAVQSLPVTPTTGTLTTEVKITRVSSSGGMIIQNFDYHVFCDAGTVYRGDTYFGFFSHQALANQVGIRDAGLYRETEAEKARARNFEYPRDAPYPADMMRMVHDVDFFDPAGGPAGLGFIRGSARVDPDAWFFRAHFYQDPVWPGSLGLESFIQLLKVVAREHWQGTDLIEFETMVPGQPHSWLYRGQIIPGDTLVTVEAMVKELDNEKKTLKADGFLSVDGRTIYQMTDFTLRMVDL